MYFPSALLPLLLLVFPFQSPGDSFRRHHEAAEAHRRAGRAAEAEAEYRAILAGGYGELCKVYAAEADYKAEVEACEAAALPLIGTPLVSSTAITGVTEYLEEALAPRETRHGVLLDLYGLGVLIEGKSGVGKSECALDLIMRGHQLVADDLVEVRRRPGQLVGSTPDLLREHMEIRGLGILNIRELFGVSAVSGPKQIGLTIRLERWEKASEVDRLGLEERTVDILGVAVPYYVLPVSPGRNLATLVETAVRVHLMRLRGYNAAESFVERHDETLRRGGEGAGDD